MTQEFGGQPLLNYDYENQNHLRPRQRRKIFPTEKEFWDYEEKVEFYVNCTEYAEFRKFKYWFYREVSLLFHFYLRGIRGIQYSTQQTPQLTNFFFGF